MITVRCTTIGWPALAWLPTSVRSAALQEQLWIHSRLVVNVSLMKWSGVSTRNGRLTKISQSPLLLAQPIKRDVQKTGGCVPRPSFKVTESVKMADIGTNWPVNASRRLPVW